MPYFDEIIVVRLQKQQVIEGVGRRWIEQVLSVCWTRTFFTEASPCVHIDNIYVLKSLVVSYLTLLWTI